MCIHLHIYAYCSTILIFTQEQCFTDNACTAWLINRDETPKNMQQNAKQRFGVTAKFNSNANDTTTQPLPPVSISSIPHSPAKPSAPPTSSLYLSASIWHIGCQIKRHKARLRAGNSADYVQTCLHMYVCARVFCTISTISQDGLLHSFIISPNSISWNIRI